MYKFNIGPYHKTKRDVNIWCVDRGLHFLAWRYTTSLHPYLDRYAENGIAYDIYVIFRFSEDALAFSLAFGIDQEAAPVETENVQHKNRCNTY